MTWTCGQTSLLLIKTKENDRQMYAIRTLLPEYKMHKLMRFHEITPGLNRDQIQMEYTYYVTNNIGKRFMDYMCDNCWAWVKNELLPWLFGKTCAFINRD